MNALPLYMHASSLVTCCGSGWAAHARAFSRMQGGLQPNAFEPAAEIATWVGRVAGVEDAALPPAFAGCDTRNNRLALLAMGHDGVEAAIRSTVSRFGASRVGVFVGTTTSGILSSELAWRAAATLGSAPALPPDFYSLGHNMFATARFIAAWCGCRGPAVTVSTACSSSAKTFAAARRAIRAGHCDAAIVAGVDSLALSTLHGFRSLQLLSPLPCRPFSAERAGISVGEAAAVVVVSNQPSDVQLVGVGESSDAFHMSTPPPDGMGAQRAMRAALDDAGVAATAIDYINLHGTGTLANDAAESAAVHAVFGHSPSASSTKGYTGHTLGAAGAVEALVAMHALRTGVVPGSLGATPVDERLQLRLETSSSVARVRRVLSNSFGFGGSNCSLVFARS